MADGKFGGRVDSVGQCASAPLCSGHLLSVLPAAVFDAEAGITGRLRRGVRYLVSRLKLMAAQRPCLQRTTQHGCLPVALPAVLMTQCHTPPGQRPRMPWWYHQKNPLTVCLTPVCCLHPFRRWRARFLNGTSPSGPPSCAPAAPSASTAGDLLSGHLPAGQHIG